MDFLFDIGNVIINVDFVSSLNKLIPPDTPNATQKLDTLLTRKDDFEAGRISTEEYFPWAAKTIDHKGSLQEFMHAWIDIFSPNEPMLKCIEDLHQSGHRLILFSNINNPHKTHLLETYPVFNCFAGGIFSYQTGHIKPEPEIYQLAIRQYQLDPANTIYIDDLKDNIVAGQNAGFRCHHYSAHQHDAFETWLAEQLS